VNLGDDKQELDFLLVHGGLDATAKASAVTKGLFYVIVHSNGGVLWVYNFQSIFLLNFSFDHPLRNLPAELEILDNSH
jgi:hypothetical protein